MNFNEFALLFAVAVPLVTLGTLNAYLWMNGETDTLLLPGVASYPAIAMAAVDVTPASIGAVAEASANEEQARVAA